VPPIVDAMTRHLLDDVATTSLFRGSDAVADGYPTPPSCGATASCGCSAPSTPWPEVPVTVVAPMGG
jgi:hypothetical protein